MTDHDQTILVWAPRGRDAVLAVELVERHGLHARKVSEVDEVIAGVLTAGCAVIASEALTVEARERLGAALAAQPPWSDFPLILFAPHGLERTGEALASIKALGNVAILERPVHSGALISALVSALRGRRRQYESREAIVRRDQFLAMLGHELRNPLAAMMLALETIPRGEPDAPYARQREVLERQGHHLARLVDDLLDVARVTSGKVRLQLAPLDLTEVAERCVHGAELTARAQRIDLHADISPQPLHVDGDQVRIEEIFNNLISNALKYSPQGARVAVRVARRGARCVLEVSDTGIGIAPDMLQRVFELFAQADGSLARSEGGLGIGLTLVRSLVQLHGGTITAHSDGLGHGSRFVVELPLSRSVPRPREAPLTVVPSDHGVQHRVLLVEDNTDLLEMTQELLESRGCEVVGVVDGEVAVTRLLEWQPDVAFIDIGLPGLDGYGVAQQARNHGSDAYLVAMTGYGQPEDRRRALAAGFDLHLAKPVGAAALEDALAACHTRPASRRSSG